MWERAQPLVSDAVPVSLEATAATVRLLLERERIVAEGAAALPVAAALAGAAGDGRVVCIVSGGNIDLARLTEILAGRSRTEGGLAHGAAAPRDRSAGLRDPGAARHRRRGRGRRSAGSPACSSTRSPRSSAATGSSSAPASATTRGRPSPGCSARAACFEFWAHQACLVPRRGLAALPRPDDARPSVAGRRPRRAPGAGRAGAGDDPRPRPRHLARLRGSGGAAGCGTGSPRRWCWRRS